MAVHGAFQRSLQFLMTAQLACILRKPLHYPEAPCSRVLFSVPLQNPIPLVKPLCWTPALTASSMAECVCSNPKA